MVGYQDLRNDKSNMCAIDLIDLSFRAKPQTEDTHVNVTWNVNVFVRTPSDTIRLITTVPT
jgi:hypothetical protein